MICKIETDERRPSRQLAELLALALAVPDDECELFIQTAGDIVIIDKLPIHHPVIDSEPSHKASQWGKQLLRQYRSHRWTDLGRRRVGSPSQPTISQRRGNYAECILFESFVDIR